jgi:hypothetical protein|tara:strand:- start:110 stop:388 length:279 start_codon:yes stop_codon:yes gene_type:complete
MPNDLSTQLNNRLEVLETELQEMQKAFEVHKSSTSDLINGTINWQHLYKTLEAVVEETMVAYPNADAILVLKEKFMQRVEPLLSRMNGGNDE